LDQHIHSFSSCLDNRWYESIFFIIYIPHMKLLLHRQNRKAWITGSEGSAFFSL
jgi:hypothetical protein